MLENLRIPIDIRAQHVVDSEQQAQIAILYPLGANVQESYAEYTWAGETLPGYALGEFNGSFTTTEKGPLRFSSVEVQLFRDTDMQDPTILRKTLRKTDCDSAAALATTTVRPMVLNRTFSDVSGFFVLEYGYSEEFEAGENGLLSPPMFFAGKDTIKQAEVREYRKLLRGSFSATLSIEDDQAVLIDVGSCEGTSCTGTLERAGSISQITSTRTAPSPPYECRITWD